MFLWLDGYWPCSWRGKQLFIKDTSIVLINSPKIGVYTNISRPLGDQQTPTELIQRSGSFILVRYDINYIFKYHSV